MCVCGISQARIGRACVNLIMLDHEVKAGHVLPSTARRARPVMEEVFRQTLGQWSPNGKYLAGAQQRLRQMEKSKSAGGRGCFESAISTEI